MELEKTEISDFIVKKVPVPPLPSIEDIAGGKMFPQLYLNCFICSRKKSGKSTVLSSIILNSINKKSNIIFFVPTINKDPTYQYILDKLDKRNINYTIYEDIFDDNGVNVLDNLISTLLEEDPEVVRKKDKKVEQIPQPFNLFETKEEEKKEKPPKKKAPRYLFVIDDMSVSSRDPSIGRLMRLHRHLKSSVFISSQNINDITPAAIRQLDYLLMFKGFTNNLEKLQSVYNNLDLPVPFETFVAIYRDATEEPFNFMWADKFGVFRKNFNKLYKFKND
jgi:hypothetical protein